MAGEYDWIGQLLGGGADLANARLSMNDANRASQIADPWAPNREQYAGQLNQYMGTNAVNPAASTARTDSSLAMLQNLLQNPQSLTSMPGYQYGLDQSLEAVNRGAGASGMLNSGNRLAALQDRGEGYARGWQQQMFNELLGNVGANINADQLGLGAQQQGFGQLAGLAGVNAGSPTAAAQALLSGRQNQQANIGAGIGGITNGLAGALPAIQRLLGGGGGGLNLGGLSPENVYGANSGWGQDVMQGGGNGGGIDWNNIFGSEDMSGWMDQLGGGDLFSAGDIFGGL